MQMSYVMSLPELQPTKCHFCGKMLMGVIKQGVKCKDCGYNAHKKCAEKVPWDCTGEVSQSIWCTQYVENGTVIM